MAILHRPLQTLNRFLINNLNSKLHQLKQTQRHFNTSNVIKGREFLRDTESMSKMQEEAAANPYPVRYMEFTTCKELYEMHSARGLTKPLSGVKFNAAYIDTNPDAKKSTPTIVCLHGSPGGHWDFNHLIIHLVNKGYRIIGLNFPGYGWTKVDQHRVFESTVAEKAHYVKDFLSCLGIEKVRMGLIHSSAAYPALMLSSEIMNVFQSLALINPGGLAIQTALEPRSLIRFYCRNYRNPLLRPFLLSFLKLMLVATGYGNTNAIQMSVALETLAFVPHEELKNYCVSMARRKFPSILIHSVNDRVVETELSMQFGALLAGIEEYSKHIYDKDGKFQSIENANPQITHMEHHIFGSGGHFVMKKYPEVVNEIVEKFLKNTEDKVK